MRSTDERDQLDLATAIHIIADNEVTRIHAGDAFTNDHVTAGNGWAHLTDPMARAGDYHAQWDQFPAGPYCASAAAFKVAP